MNRTINKAGKIATAAMSAFDRAIVDLHKANDLLREHVVGNDAKIDEMRQHNAVAAAAHTRNAAAIENLKALTGAA